LKIQFNLLSGSLLTLSALATAINAAAQTSESSGTTAKIDEIVVTSSRVEQPLREVGTSISVFSENDLSAIGSTDLADVLRTAPGIGVSNSGGLGKPTTLRIRGEEGYRTKVLIDGMDVSDVSTPQIAPQMQQIMTRGVSRIEILRGPQGMMYGADAGGVVNISTRRVEEGLQGDVAVETGRYDSLTEFGQIGGANDLGDFNVSALHVETDGFNARSTDTTLRDGDGYENNT